jgi:hypothetical protein
MTDPDPQGREAARRKLIGRVVVILLGLLVLAYAIPTFMR